MDRSEPSGDSPSISTTPEAVAPSVLATVEPSGPAVAEAATTSALETDRHVRFLGLDVAVAPNVLVPRTETELLARTAISLLKTGVGGPARIVDMCCGAGNLAVAIAHFVADARVWGADLTGACVDTARANASAHGLEDRVLIVRGDLFDAFMGMALEGLIDGVVCNPPYISTRRLETDRRHLLEREPREAFDAGPYGLSIHQRVIGAATKFLRDGGWMCCEFGVGQAKQVARLFERTGSYGPVSFACDQGGEPRVAIATRLPR